MLFFNVREAPYNAAGNGTSDDASKIQDAIDDIRDASPHEQCALVIPAGRYAIGSTLDFRGLRGLSVLGAGAMRTSSYMPTAKFVGTVIMPIPDEAAPDVMLDFSETDGAYVRGLSVLGQPAQIQSEGNLDRAEIGVFFATPEEGAATGNLLFEDVVVMQCDTAVHAGDPANPANSSDCTFIRFKAQDCDVGFYAAHNQAVNFSFVAPIFEVVGIAFKLCGSSIHASQVSTYDVETLVYVAPYAYAGGTMCGGINLGCITIDNARLDGVAHRTQIYVVDDSATYYEPVLAEFRNVGTAGGMLSTSGPARCVLRNGSYVRLVGCTFLADANGPVFDALDTQGTKHAVIDIEGCFLPNDLPPAMTQYLHGTCDAIGKYRVRDCLDQDSDYAPVADFDN